MTGPDGRTWWVGRRWLPWRPKRRELDGDSNCPDFDFADEPIGCLIGLVVAGVVLAVPIVAALIIFVAEWLIVLLVLPIAVLVRVALGKPWVISARGRSAAGANGGTRARSAAGPRRGRRSVRWSGRSRCSGSRGRWR